MSATPRWAGLRTRAEVCRVADPKLLAAVAHEGAIKPTNNEKYRKILDQRRLESEQTRR